MPTGGSKTKGRAKTTNLPDDEEEYLMYNDFTSTGRHYIINRLIDNI